MTHQRSGVPTGPVSVCGSLSVRGRFPRLCISMGAVKKLLASARRRLGLTDRMALIAGWSWSHG